jgi:sporulation protein YlmC with PRC-barrel domain
VLHKTSKLRGLHVVATDGEIGHVDDVLVDERTWTVRYLVVDTSNWIGGRSVLIAPSVLTNVDAVNRTIQVSLTREEIRRSPSVEAADIDPAETLPTIWIM